MVVALVKDYYFGNRTLRRVINVILLEDTLRHENII